MMIKGKLKGTQPAVSIRLDGYQVSDACKIVKMNACEIDNIIVLNYETSYNTYDTWSRDVMNDIIISEEDFDINNYETYYRYPRIDLSRDKMAVFTDKYKIRKVLDPQKSDFRIISTEFIKKLASSSWRNSLSSVKSIRSILTKFPDTFEKQLISKINMAIDNLPDDHLAIIKYEHRWNNKYKDKDMSRVINLLDQLDYGSLTYIETEKNIDKFNSLFDPNVIFVTDTYMNEISGEDSVILDDDSYKNIRDMLKSTDDANISMGMSMMANCNVAKSKTYLALLFFHFSEKLRRGPLWNQVGFKTIKKQFEKYVLEHNHYHSDRYSSCIRALAEDDALTLKAAQHLIKMVFDKVINGNCGLNDNRSVFTLDISAIGLIDEFAKEVKKGSTISEIVLENNKELITDDLPF